MLELEVFTTRVDTIFGVTFMTIAPEHELVSRLTTSDQKKEVEAYVKASKMRSERERLADVKQVTGVFTGSYVKHPFTGDKVPIWVADYVLAGYGTGIVMAVPSSDERDFAFATHFNLPIVQVQEGAGTRIDTDDCDPRKGTMINSGFLNGMEVPEAIEAATRKVESMGIGKEHVNFRMRDAVFSRQRYWGEPFPIIYDNEGVAETLSLSDLPLELPEIDDFKPATDARSPLAKADEWLNLPQGKTRETDTMPGFAGSSWYFLRYMDPHNDRAFAGEEALGYWRDVDLYIGGTEHAVGHLLYARFWHKFLHDIGLVPTKEPFKKLINQGMIQGVIESIFLLKEKKDGKQHFISSDMLEDLEDDDYTVIPVHVDFVKDYGTEKSYLDKESVKQFINWRPENKGALFQSDTGIYDSGLVEGREQPDFKLYTYSEIGKMSKRYFNVVNPDDVVEEYGADCFRMYEMFLGPVEQSKPWDTNGIDGVSKFLRRFWSLFHDSEGNWIVEEAEGTEEEKKILHQAIKNITEDIERFSFNTCISHFMICTNDLKKLRKHSKGILESLVQLIAPFAPHLGEELWEKLGHKSSVMDSVYPVFDPEILKKESIEYPIAINGKKRGMASFPADATPADIQAEVTSIEEIQKWLLDKEVKRIIVVPKRMVNIVV
jgi:leucyl-tRNA synthetase